MNTTLFCYQIVFLLQFLTISLHTISHSLHSYHSHSLSGTIHTMDYLKGEGNAKSFFFCINTLLACVVDRKKCLKIFNTFIC